MSIKSFFQSLLPHMERNRIIEDIDALATDLESNLIPSYEAANKLLGGRKLLSKPGADMQAMFKLRYPDQHGISHLAFTLKTMRGLLDTLKVLERTVPEIFDRDVTKDSLTYKKVAVLQFLTAVRFYNDYAGRHLLRVIAAEDNAAKGLGETDMRPIDKKYFDENFEAWLQLGHIVSLPAATIAARLGEMQDLSVVVDKINVATSTLGYASVDPLKLGLSGASAVASPIYKIRSAIATYHVAAHAARKEETKMLQLRLFSLRDALASRTDPKLQEQINYTESRLLRLREDVATFEERYGS